MIKHLLTLAAAIGLAHGCPALAKPGNGHGHSDWNRDPGGGCPPGLAKKGNGCMPPGQERKLERGQRWVRGEGTFYSYQRIPSELRRRYRLSSRYDYYYNGGTIYVVDPRSMLIAQVISALLH